MDESLGDAFFAVFMTFAFIGASALALLVAIGAAWLLSLFRRRR